MAEEKWMQKCEESVQFCNCLREQLEGFNVAVN
jgi:hypothetical protein